MTKITTTRTKRKKMMSEYKLYRVHCVLDYEEEVYAKSKIDAFIKASDNAVVRGEWDYDVDEVEDEEDETDN